MHASIPLFAMLFFLIEMSTYSSAAALDPAITGKDGAPMVLIPAGVFPMGVPQGDRDGGRDEYPRHECPGRCLLYRQIRDDERPLFSNSSRPLATAFRKTPEIPPEISGRATRSPNR